MLPHQNKGTNMLNRFKNVVSNVMGATLPHLGEGSPSDPESTGGGRRRSRSLPVVAADGPTEPRFEYDRPVFLQLSQDEVQVAADTVTRPILVPRDISRLPWNAGYAEVINAGKTKLSEDQAWAGVLHVPAHSSQVPDLHPDDLSDGLSSPGSDLQPGTDLSHKSSPTSPPVSPTSSAPTSDFQILADDPLPFVYFGLFDGHAGTGAALMAVRLLHRHIQAQLSLVRELLIAKRYHLDLPPARRGIRHVGVDRTNSISVDDLVIGALETAFQVMDSELAAGLPPGGRQRRRPPGLVERAALPTWLCRAQQWDDQIGRERSVYRIPGGCTAVTAIFFLGKLYVANAGDSRAILCVQNQVVPMSSDFTPETEKQRIQYLGYLQPELLKDEFTYLEFARRVTKRDLGQKLLYRDALMRGWSYKTITEDDLKYPLVHGEGKRARVLATIGVTRGFGDHDLCVQASNIHIKPFLLAIPQVKIYDICEYEHSENDVLIMGSDGLWDVTTNEKAAQIVSNCLKQFDIDDRTRYTSAAQELVLYARGLLTRGWRTPDDTPASADDISAFVIPIYRYSDSGPESSSTESSLDASSS